MTGDPGESGDTYSRPHPDVLPSTSKLVGGVDVEELRKVAAEIGMRGRRHMEDGEESDGSRLLVWTMRILKALKEEPCPSPCKSSAGQSQCSSPPA